MSKIVQSPGEFLSNMLEKHKLSILKLSKDINLSQSAVRSVAIGKTGISVPVALRLARYFNTNPEYWLKMQMDWDLAEAAQDKKLMDMVKKISKFQKEPDAGKKTAARKPAADKSASGSAAARKGAAKAVPAKKGAKPVSARKGATKPAAAKGAAQNARKKPADSKAKPAAKRGRKSAE